jgi:hypothetical protein
MRSSFAGLIAVISVASCRKEPVIVAEAADSASISAPLPSDAGAANVAEVEAATEASDAGSDACAPGETWEARVVVRKTWHANASMMLQGPLELVVDRIGIRKTIYPDCGITGGGCGDCSKPIDPTRISCDLAPTHARVSIGIDDVGPTSVNVVQRGDAIVAEWTTSPSFDDPPETKPTSRSETLAKLPCAVTIRFVR